MVPATRDAATAPPRTHQRLAMPCQEHRRPFRNLLDQPRVTEDNDERGPGRERREPGQALGAESRAPLGRPRLGEGQNDATAARALEHFLMGECPTHDVARTGGVPATDIVIDDHKIEAVERRYAAADQAAREQAVGDCIRGGGGTTG